MIIRDFLLGGNGLPISRFWGFSSILDCIRGSIYKGNITGNWCRVAKPSFGRFGWSNVINFDQVALCEAYLAKKMQIWGFFFRELWYKSFYNITMKSLSGFRFSYWRRRLSWNRLGVGVIQVA